MTSHLTVTGIMAMATRVLLDAAFVQAEENSGVAGDLAHGRLFEDRYSVVGICAWEDWKGLRSEWPRAQGWLVEIISERIDRSEAKAWDGYIVLLTPARVPQEDRATLDAIRYDTTRLRKLVGVDLSSEAAVKRVLSPLLPLDPQLLRTAGSSLGDLLLEMIKPEVAPPDTVQALVDAFKDGRPLVDSIHRALHSEDHAD
jgi:hypothetical protein